MFWRLTTVADDFGRFEADPRLLRAACFPLWGDRLKIAQVAKWYAELVAAEIVTSYLVAGKSLGFFTTWEKYQTVRAKASKFPAPTADNICSQPPPYVSVFENRESRIEMRESDESRNGARSSATLTQVVFQIPEAIVSALNRAPRLGAVTRLRNPAWWQAIIRANRGVDFPAEVLKAEAYLVSHPERRYKDLAKFLHGWMSRADRSVTA